MTRVLVCGGRNYGRPDGLLTFGTPTWNADRKRANAEADALVDELSRLHAEHGFSLVIHGAAKGADALAKAWAKRNGVPDEPYKADWYPNGFGKLDKSAGPRRNAKMIAEGRPDLVVAFTGCAGTADCVRRAREAGVPVIEVKG